MKRNFLCIALLNVFNNNCAMMSTHINSRSRIYPRSSVERFSVPDDKVSWSTEFEAYRPVNYTSPDIHGKPWADPEIGPNFKPLWNKLDGNVDRSSHMGEYKIVDGYPQNPIGRTGIVGRGVLGRWGPNHAADPIVTRWKRLDSGDIETDSSNKPILQFVAIRRRDSGEWALPGGMVDPGEKVATAALREFQEEALNSFAMTNDEKSAVLQRFNTFFSQADEVYKGYVDDWRNTDNAWMETVAFNFHDEPGTTVGMLKLHAGDDAVGVRWVDITPDLQLYASHGSIIREVYKRHISKPATNKHVRSL
ncbi:ADP-ribose pyrophosphatase, mitochondrial isoform X1 [Ostrinia furnacalis]|uniref:ADP-ribose pyrophosphatase, mitochondrial isoform X1 n=2 Tax=Ostrinia furnacalis TaxID=93504 RepID=UPI001038F549|nr:ADP-ribose pyrophosphatase, mitochondrial isoform X1 [Ostrinia furnacalis]